MLVVPAAAAALVLAVAGASKIRDPAPTAGALRALRLPSSLPLVRLLGAGELLLGGAAVFTRPAPVAWALAAAYGAFTAFVAVALRRGTKLQSCGCFGGLEVAPTALHVVVDAAAAVVLAVAAVRGTPALLSALDGEPGAGVPLLSTAVVAAGLAIAVLTALPMARGEARR